MKRHGEFDSVTVFYEKEAVEPALTIIRTYTAKQKLRHTHLVPNWRVIRDEDESRGCKCSQREMPRLR